MNAPPTRALTLPVVRQQLVDMTPEIMSNLPPNIKPERFVSVAMTAVQQTPKLLQCDPESLFSACKKAALDGLLPDGREGAIVPRWSNKNKRLEATWQPMILGIVAKAKRRGSVVNLVANIVYQGEPFEVLMGDEDRIIHRRDINMVKRGQEIAVYAIATLKDGTKEREVMTWEQVMDVRKSSSDPDSGPWVQWTDEMARKSCVRRLSKRLPALDDGDDDLKQAIERVDELYPFGKNAPKPAPQTIEAKAEPAAPAKRAAPAPVAEPEAPTYGADEPYAARLDDLSDRLAAETDGAKWMLVLKAGTEAAETADEVAAIEGLPNVQTAMNKAPARVRGDMQLMFATAFKRVMPADAGPAFVDGEVA